MSLKPVSAILFLPVEQNIPFPLRLIVVLKDDDIVILVFIILILLIRFNLNTPQR
jgi:hypothetical protein